VSEPVAKSRPKPSLPDVLEVVSALVFLAGVVALVVSAFLVSFVLGVCAAGVGAVLVGSIGVFVASRLDAGVAK